MSINKDITLFIKTFDRPECVDKLINSIRKNYPEVPIMVANDGKLSIPSYDENVSVFRLPFDTGLSYGRNYMVDKCKTKYYVLLDDDFVFNEDTDLGIFYDLIKSTDYDIIGGMVNEATGPLSYFGNFDEYESYLEQVPVKLKENGITRCELILNFFIADVKATKQVKWDNELKLAEHTDFFRRAALNNIKVGVTQAVSIFHDRVRNSNYNKFRNRGKEFVAMWMNKNKLTHFKNVHGTITYVASNSSKVKVVDSLPTNIKQNETKLRTFDIKNTEASLKVNEILTDTNPKTDNRFGMGYRLNYGIHRAYKINEVKFFDDTPNEDEYQDDIYQRAKQVQETNSYESVLDIGCGSGYKLLKYFGEQKTLGLDLEPTLSFLKSKYSDKEWGLSDFYNTPTGSWDVIILSDVIEHVQYPDELLAMLKQIDFKKCIISTPDRTITPGRNRIGPPINKYHVREWSNYELIKYLNLYFNVTDSRHFAHVQCIEIEKR